ncbi:MAG TPA: thioredoxin family protein [Verrucomicrobiae bacterium]|nr:thioredoxin family protein [Verrucomicrobiae bacterium]
MTQSATKQTKVVSREEWLTARKALLEREKRLTRERDAIAAERRKLPWVKVDKEYVFDTPKGKKTLAELFEGRSQLVVYHFMMGPGWPAGCPGCSLIADHLNGSVAHLANRDVTLIAVSRAPLPEIEAFKKRMGWTFKWASSYGSDFNYDCHVSCTKDELDRGEIYYNYRIQKPMSEERPGLSVFYKDEDGEVYHTYSAYARQLEPLMGVYVHLDMVPKGRMEEGLRPPSAWLRHHDRYEQNYYADAVESEPVTRTMGGSGSNVGMSAKNSASLNWVEWFFPGR